MPEPCECHREVARLHRFFQDWFRGEVPDTEFVVCEQALAPGFTIVTPGGVLIARDDILGAIRGHHSGEPPDFGIRTVGRACQRRNGLHISTYEEHQTGTRSTIRLSTAVLSTGSSTGSNSEPIASADAFQWHSVHETWITA